MSGGEIKATGLMFPRVIEGGTTKYTIQTGYVTSCRSEMSPSAPVLRAWSLARGVLRGILKWGLDGRKLGHWGSSMS